MFTDIFEYHHEFNNKILEEIVARKDSLPNRSFPLFCHILNAHQIWNARILGEKSFGVMDLHEMENCRNINLNNYQKTLQIIEKYDVTDIVTYTNSKGKEFTNSIGDILFHVANHTTHHRGQIVSDFRSKDIEPIVSDYIFHKRS
jgi:Uncharacterized protein conserved in bacteria